MAQAAIAVWKAGVEIDRVALAQYRGGAESLELQRQLVKTDTHAVARYRVIGPISNAPEFQQAFACQPGSPMVRPPDARCQVW